MSQPLQVTLKVLTEDIWKMKTHATYQIMVSLKLLNVQDSRMTMVYQLKVQYFLNVQGDVDKGEIILEISNSDILDVDADDTVL